MTSASTGRSKADSSSLREKGAGFLASNPGKVILVLLIMLGTYLLNTAFGSMLGMVLTIAILAGVAWFQRFKELRASRPKA